MTKHTKKVLPLVFKIRDFKSTKMPILLLGERNVFDTLREYKKPGDILVYRMILLHQHQKACLRLEKPQRIGIELVTIWFLKMISKDLN